MPQVTMKEMLDAGVHFGHQVQRWNPKMKPFVFGERGGIHIIDLQKTVVAANKAIEFVRKRAAEGHRMIFVGTKRQAVEAIQETANSCGQFYVTKRWLGGTLTNFQTIKASIDRLRKIEIMKEKGELDVFNKKERASIEKEFGKLTEYLNGIRDMKETPGIMFVVDIKKEHIAVAEAKRLGIPVVGIADTNTDPEVIDFPIPGNDDAIRSIKLFSRLVAEAYSEGSKEWDVKKQALLKQEQEDAAKKAKEKDETSKDEADSDGPKVVKRSRPRLVAAGTADEEEIRIELETQAPEAESTENSEDNSKPDDASTDKETSES